MRKGVKEYRKLPIPQNKSMHLTFLSSGCSVRFALDSSIICLYTQFH